MKFLPNKRIVTKWALYAYIAWSIILDVSIISGVIYWFFFN